MRILVIEDSPTDRDLLVGAAGDIGLQADSAGSGEEALAMLAANPYDLAIIDFRLPDDGVTLCRRMLAVENNVDLIKQSHLRAITNDLRINPDEPFIPRDYVSGLCRNHPRQRR